MALNQCLNLILTRAQQVVHQHFRTQLEVLDVTPVQYAVLDTLWKEDNLTPSQIAGSISLDSSTVTGILDRLENKNLVKRMPDPTDRRAVRVTLTNNGRELEEPLMKIIAECNQTVMKVFTLDEQEVLIKILQRLA